MAKEKLVGKISHFFDNIEVAVVEITAGVLKVGDKIHIKGGTTDFEQDIESMQVEHESVEKAKKGDGVGLKVGEKVRKGDKVYIVSD